jgi:hypothetical protein
MAIGITCNQNIERMPSESERFSLHAHSPLRRTLRLSYDLTQLILCTIRRGFYVGSNLSRRARVVPSSRRPRGEISRRRYIAQDSNILTRSFVRFISIVESPHARAGVRLQ